MTAIDSGPYPNPLDVLDCIMKALRGADPITTLATVDVHHPRKKESEINHNLGRLVVSYRNDVRAGLQVTNHLAQFTIGLTSWGASNVQALKISQTVADWLRSWDWANLGLTDQNCSWYNVYPPKFVDFDDRTALYFSDVRLDIEVRTSER